LAISPRRFDKSACRLDSAAPVGYFGSFHPNRVLTLRTFALPFVVQYIYILLEIEDAAKIRVFAQ
jgi:hypothetical protein